MFDSIDILAAAVGGLCATVPAIITYIVGKNTKERQVSNNEMTLNTVARLKERREQSRKANNSGKQIDENNDERISTLIHNHHRNALREAPHRILCKRFSTKSEATIYFWFSLVFSVIGFVVIVYFALVAQGKAWYDYAVRVLPGVIVEAVSVLFFTQSKATRERGVDFLDRLRADRQYELEDRQYEKGLKIIEGITDEALKSELKAEIAMRLCGIQSLEVGTRVRTKRVEKQLD